jgi:adenine-specific DNA-methyltransferase
LSLPETLVPPLRPASEDPAYLSQQLITYIGNKRALLPFIGKGLEQVKARLGKERLACLDLFSGTGVVARYLKQHASHITANDLEAYSQISNRCYLSNASEVAPGHLNECLLALQAEIAKADAPGFIAELYAPSDDARIEPGERAFYTRRNAQYLDSARQAIERLPVDMRDYFLAPLLALASVHANTSGVFKGFYKSHAGVGRYGGEAGNALSRILKPIEVQKPLFSRFECTYEVTRLDANAFVEQRREHHDLAYLDPPYNQHPYGSNYFMLNLLAEYRRPQALSKVSGIPQAWNRSRYNRKQEAEAALFQVIEACNASFLMISYNSEGFIPHERFLQRLGTLGRISVLETPYNAFRGSRNLAGRAKHVTEFLYLLEK